jgi:hypothetical protein
MRAGRKETSPNRRHGRAEQRHRWPALARCLLAVSALSCSSPMTSRRPSDGSVVQPDASATLDMSSPSDTGQVQPDTSSAFDLPSPSDTMQAVDGTLARRCAEQTVGSSLVPVRGTVRGPKVEGEICDNGVGTFFLGPNDIDHTYDQDFDTNTWLDAPYSPTGYDSSLVYGFFIRAPADAESAVLVGSVGAVAAEVGTYDSKTNCGSLDFEVTLPIPPGVVCTTEFGPCDPGCEGSGEMWVCLPANAKLHYAARPSAACSTRQDPAQGSWVLTLTSVSPYITGNGYKHHDTHGNLTATLVNQADPSDSVVLNLDF